eukprot:scaffold5366_cov128-Isochrysis_galbana.AAC.1
MEADAHQRLTHASVDYLRWTRWHRCPQPGRRHAFLIFLCGSANARKQPRHGSCVPNPDVQQDSRNMHQLFE